MASFVCNENDLSAVNSSPIGAPDGDRSTDDFVIKQRIDICDLTDDSIGFITEIDLDPSISAEPIAEQAQPSEQDIRRLQEESERESERLAWELMQQDSLDAYNFQIEFMRENSAAMDPEDLAALESAMAEERRAIALPAEEEEGEQPEEENSEEWTYDRLLELGQAVGDVKTERWRLQAAAVIKSLPDLAYGSEELNQRSKHAAHDTNCVVCMEDFQKGENVRLLPCQHFFHTACADQWLESNKTCPSCKEKITQSP